MTRATTHKIITTSPALIALLPAYKSVLDRVSMLTIFARNHMLPPVYDSVYGGLACHIYLDFSDLGIEIGAGEEPPGHLARAMYSMVGFQWFLSRMTKRTSGVPHAMRRAKFA
jgi:hypothetical protein